MRSLLLIPMLFLAACASNPHKAVELDTKVERVTPVGNDSVIGVKNGNMIYQKKYLIGEELRTAQIKAHEMEAKLYGGPRYYDNYGMLGALKMCRKKVSVLTDGKLAWSEKLEYVIPEHEEMSVGIGESGSLTAVTEEYLKDRIARFRGYQEVLGQRTEEMQLKIDQCEAELTHIKNQEQQSVAAQ